MEGLSKTFETPKGQIRALHELSFDIHRREFITVIGHPVAEKLPHSHSRGVGFPISGQVLLKGKKVDGPSAEQGMVFQDYTLFRLTVKKM